MSYRYNTIAITLHWVIAACILINLGFGWWMGDALNDEATQNLATNVFQWHKSLGLLILVLSLLRLGWRLLHPAPPLPEATVRWEQLVARLTHIAFYGLMIGTPLSGWLYVSTQWRGDNPLNVPTVWFGLFEVPHLLVLNTLPSETRELLASWILPTHEYLAWAFALLLVLHIGAALRHHFLLKDAVLTHMIPALAKISPQKYQAKTRPLTAAATTLSLAGLLAIGLSISGEAPEQNASSAEQALAELSADFPTGLPHWQLLPDESHIHFSGTHAGKAFKGEFTRWQAELRFDEATGTPAIAVVIDTASATDGVPMHDRTLPQEEWFNASTYPFATYTATTADALGDNRYALPGTLTIKQHRIAMAPLTLEQTGDTLRIYGELKIDRADVDMGMESDPKGEWVSREIRIQVNALATRLSP